ncbi:protein Wnt-7b-like isoform X1 [Oculina patagonica]
MENQHALTLITLLLATVFAHNLMEANSKLFVVSSVATLGPSLICSRIPGLSPKQIAICEEYPKVINCIREGYRMGAEECKFQFRKNRWNCTLLGQTSVFDDRAVPGTKEAAYTQAIISAGVVYTITKACSMGNLSECNCDRRKWGQKSNKGWMWGGCSVDVSYGIDLSDRFVNARRSKEDAIFLMNKHNSRAGRQVVKENLVFECKCHGISASCATRTCWKALPSIRQIGKSLKEYYHIASKVKPKMAPSAAGPKPEFLVLASDNKTRPERSTLVYLNKSDDYCARDARFGIPGTQDRVCNKTSDGPGSCDYMCCGRGHDTHNFTEMSQCKCKFHWCCEVKCQECVEIVIKHTCK